jgi:hypothetical protein
VPVYRRLSWVPISMNSVSGNTWATGQTISRFQLCLKWRGTWNMSHDSENVNRRPRLRIVDDVTIERASAAVVG